VLGLHVADHRLDGGAPLELARICLVTPRLCSET
jgi:hypothetical protein